MSERPEVSVVLAVRDGEREIGSTIDNILEQRGIQLELIVVDDGSRDGTSRRIEEAAARDSRVVAIRQEALGLTAGLIRGCAAARAPLIARQDAGDLSHPDRLVRQRDLLLADPTRALVSCWTACVGPRGEPLYVARCGVDPDVSTMIDPDASAEPEPGPSSHGSALFRRDCFEKAGGYRPEFRLAQDWDLWYRIGELGSFATVGSTLYLRVLHPTSLGFGAHDIQVGLRRLAREAARRRRRMAPEAAILERAARLSARFERERTTRRLRGEALGNYHLGALLDHLGDGSAGAYFAAAVRRRPTFLRAWLRWAGSARKSSRSRPPSGFDGEDSRQLLGALRSSLEGAA